MSVTLITADEMDLGIRSISKYLKNKGISTRLIVLAKKKPKYSQRVLHELRSLVSDSTVIGISFRFISLAAAIQINRVLKELSVPIVAGGTVAITNPEICLKYFDIVCITEGERAMFNLHRVVTKGGRIEQVEGFYFKKGNKYIKNETKSQKNIFLEFDYTCENEYLLIDEQQLRKINEPPMFHFDCPGSFPAKSIFMVSARGCLFSCTYCCSSVINRKLPYKKLSLRNILSQLRTIKEKYPDLSYVNFMDSNFLARPFNEIEKFSQFYKKDIGVPFWIFCDPRTIDSAKLSVLVQAGLKQLGMGIQSGSEHTNFEIYNRKITKKQIRQAAIVISKYVPKMKPPKYDMLVNHPLEKRTDILQTIGLLRELATPFSLVCHDLILFPGTKLFERIQSNELSSHPRLHRFRNRFQELWGDHELHLNRNDKEFYVNSVLLWTEGLWNKSYCGSVPRIVLDYLTKKSVVRFMSRNPALTDFLNQLFSKFRGVRKHFSKNNCKQVSAAC